jgi:hypothetical protein
MAKTFRFESTTDEVLEGLNLSANGLYPLILHLKSFNNMNRSYASCMQRILYRGSHRSERTWPEPSEPYSAG